jgi:hypothetical protein
MGRRLYNADWRADAGHWRPTVEAVVTLEAIAEALVDLIQRGTIRLTLARPGDPPGIPEDVAQVVEDEIRKRRASFPDPDNPTF